MKCQKTVEAYTCDCCGLDSCGTDAWQRLADLIDRPSENIERPR